MYLIDFTILVKQLLPPHWLNTYREWLCQVMVAPLIGIYKGLLRYRSEVLSVQNIKAQVGVVEYHLNRMYAQADYRFIEIIDGKEEAQCIVLIHEQYAHNKQVIYNYLQTLMPFGFTFIISSKK